ncbi:MAG: proteasome assembly chaperone family protein [Thermoplasmata archaeon]|nr:proteasome assembly chaperone family protein [Thermoplasmata archaeon]
MEDIIIYELEKMNLNGAVVIDGFPSMGLVSTIVGNYIINSLDLKPIGIVDSPTFPSLAIVRRSEPLSPVRIYAGKNKGSDDESDIEKPQTVVVFISEFILHPQLVRPVANAMMDWFEEKKCDIIISAEGIGQEIPLLHSGSEDKKDIPVYGIGSTTRVRKMIKANKITPLTNGAITGVTATLLSAGKRREIDVLCLLTEASELFPDARAAGKILEIIDRVSLRTKIDTTPLFKEAEFIEKQIKKMQMQAEPVIKKTVPPSMYG